MFGKEVYDIPQKEGKGDDAMTKDGIVIIVNGDKHAVQQPELTGVQILKLAGFDDPPTETVLIDYRGGPDSNPEGVLKPEETNQP